MTNNSETNPVSAPTQTTTHETPQQVKLNRHETRKAIALSRKTETLNPKKSNKVYKQKKQRTHQQKESRKVNRS